MNEYDKPGVKRCAPRPSWNVDIFPVKLFDRGVTGIVVEASSEMVVDDHTAVAN